MLTSVVEKGRSVELREYAKIVRKYWALIVFSVLIGALLAAGISFLATPKYESSAELYVSVRNDGAATSDLVQGSNFAQQAVSSYVEIATSAIVLERVIEDLSLDESVESLASRIQVTSPSDTVLMRISVTDPDPVTAAEVANSTGEALAEVVENELELSHGDDAGPVQIETIQPGNVAENPSSPRVLFNMLVGILLGLVAGLLAAVIRFLLDTRIHSLRDIEQTLDLPVLGGIAHDRKMASHPLIVHSDRLNPRAESFRALRTNLQFVATEDEARVFVVSSSVPDEGKTTTATNLAIALAETGASVALVDADLRKPSVADTMGIEGGTGLTDVLIGRAELQDVLQPWGRAELAVLASGPIPPNPSELLGSAAMQRVVRVLGETVDYVIIDSPPILPVTDAAVVSRFATGVILVAAAGSTKRAEIEAAVESVESSGVNLLGVVGTKLPTKGPDGYTYGTYRYAYEGDEEPVIQAPVQSPPKRARTRRRS